MKQALINYMKRTLDDEFYTPEYAITPLLKYLPTSGIFWECTDFGNSNITKVLRESGRKVITSHINSGIDFLNDEPEDHYDYIISNPPYSIKTDFLRRAYSLGKPFYFLLPITSLEGIERGKLFREFGIQVLVFDKRVDFVKGGSAWFNTSWFCWNMLPRDLIFEELIKESK